MSGPQKFHVLLSLNVWGDKAKQRETIYEELKLLGLTKVDATAADGLYTTFVGEMTLSENLEPTLDGQLRGTKDRIEAVLNNLLEGCGYMFMWGTAPNFGGSAYK